MNRKEDIQKLIDKALKSNDSQDALRFSQAALNAGHAQNIISAVQQPPSEITEENVNRFLTWELPDDFAPDAGISFAPKKIPAHCWPVGTNLFTAVQAKAMLEHVFGINSALSKD